MGEGERQETELNWSEVEAAFRTTLIYFVESWVPAADNSQLIRSGFGIQPDQANILVSLNRRCFSLSKSVASLLNVMDLDGAQTLIRSFIEGSANFIYIASPRHDSTCSDRLHEYSTLKRAMSAVTDTRDVERFKSLFEKVIGSREAVDEKFPWDAQQSIDIAKNIEQNTKNNISKRWKPINVIFSAFDFYPNHIPDILLQYMLSCHFSHVSHPSLEMFSDSYSLHGLEHELDLIARALNFLMLMVNITDVRFVIINAMSGNLDCQECEESLHIRELIFSLHRKIPLPRRIVTF